MKNSGIRLDRLGNAFSKTPVIIYLGAWIAGADLCSKTVIETAICAALLWAGLYTLNEAVDRWLENDQNDSLTWIVGAIFCAYPLFNFDGGQLVVALLMILSQLAYTAGGKRKIRIFLLLRIAVNPFLRILMGMMCGHYMGLSVKWLALIPLLLVHVSSVTWTLQGTAKKRTALGYETLQSYGMAAPLQRVFTFLINRHHGDIEKERVLWFLAGVISLPVLILLWWISN